MSLSDGFTFIYYENMGSKYFPNFSQVSSSKSPTKVLQSVFRNGFLNGDSNLVGYTAYSTTTMSAYGYYKYPYSFSVYDLNEVSSGSGLASGLGVGLS